jgi:hypothetical protein
VWVRSLGSFAAALVLGSCAGLHRSPDDVPAPGRYQYSGQYRPEGAHRPVSFQGVLTITRATAERVTGRWDVPGFEPNVQLGTQVQGWYLANADVYTPGVRGTFRHQVRRDSRGTGLGCTGVFLERVGATFVTHPATCSLHYLDGG